MVTTQLGRVLHVGSGHAHLPEWLEHEQEVRLDINPGCNPDIVASASNLGDVGSFDAIYSSHFLEHVYPHELPLVFAEFKRVLNPGGMVITIVPDLEDVQPTEEVLYESDAGPVTGLDMFYGMRKYVEAFPYMEHHNAFTAASLEKTLLDAGFVGVFVKRLSYSLLATAVKA